MATFRSVQVSFWSDTKIAEDFSVEERYFFLYLLTNTHTTLSGCYEISFKQMSDESGLTREKCQKLLERFETEYGVAIYSKDTREILIVNWHRHNWTGSEKYRAAVEKQIAQIKNEYFKRYLTGILRGDDTVSIPYLYSMDTSISISNTSTSTNTNTISNTVTNNSNAKKSKDPIKQYGEYKHVLLADEDYQKLCKDFGTSIVDMAIKCVDEYCERSGKNYKNYNLVLRKWGIDEAKKQIKTQERASPYDLEEIEKVLVNKV